MNCQKKRDGYGRGEKDILEGDDASHWQQSTLELPKSPGVGSKNE